MPLREMKRLGISLQVALSAVIGQGRDLFATTLWHRLAPMLGYKLTPSPHSMETLCQQVGLHPRIPFLQLKSPKASFN